MGRILLSALMVLSVSAQAGWRLSTDVELIGGYEMVQKTTRGNHTLNRLVWGARVALGTYAVALEVEFLRGTDEEVFTGPALTVQDTDLMAKAGLRTHISLSRVVRWYLRAGAQVTKNSHQEDDGTGFTQTLGPLTYSPYFGTGLNVEILRNLLHWKIGLTAVFVNFPTNYGLNNYQAISSLSLRFP